MTIFGTRITRTINRNWRVLLAVPFALLLAPFGGAATVTTGGSGNWNSTAVDAPWPGGAVPAAGSDIIIAPGHSVTVTATVASSPGTVTIDTGGQLSVGGFNLTVGGATTVSGTLLHTSTAGTHTFAGDVMIASGGIWNETAAVAVSFGGSLRNDGTLSAGAGVHTFTGIGKIVGGANELALPKATITGTCTNDGTLAVSTALAGAGALTQGVGATLKLGGPTTTAITLTTLNASNAPNTVIYYGAAQTVKPATYGNLILSGSGIKTIVTATVIVNGLLSMEGTCTASLVPTYGTAATLQYNTGTARTTGPEWKTPFTASGGVIIAHAGTITLAAAKVFGESVPLAINSGASLASGNFKLTLGGAFANAGSFVPGTGTVEWSSAGAQSLPAGAFHNVILSGSGAKSIAASTTVAGNLSVAPAGNATADLAPGLNLEVASLTLGGLSRASGTWGSTSAPGAAYQDDRFFSPSTGYLTVMGDARAVPLVTWPVASTIITGQMLSASTLSGGGATNAGAAVAGVFAFSAPGTVPQAGPYNAEVTFTPADPTSFTIVNGTVTVAVASLKTYYVVPVNPLSQAPYDTWETAATNIQAAVDQASADLIPGTVECMVIVTNGLYASSANATNIVEISKNITLRGVGPDKVTISGAGAKRVIAITTAGATVEGFTIAHGSRPNGQYGTGINMTGGTVQNCIISNNVLNVRSGLGGGVYMSGGTLQDCELVANVAAGSDGSGVGAAVYAANALIQRCRIHGNSATASSTLSAGAVYLVNNSRLRNCLVYNNTAGGSVNPSLTAGSLTAGVYSGGSGNRIDHCTIVGNTTQSGVGAGLYLVAGSASNNIVYYNSTEFTRDYRLMNDNVYKSAAASISHSCFFPEVAGATNTSAEPQFADWWNGDFRLLPGSPCLDTAAFVSDLGTDIEGTARTADGDGNGAGAPDMGALEAVAASAGSLRCTFVALTNEAVGSAAVAFTAFAAGPDTNNLSVAWDFENDGVDDAAGFSAAHAYGLGFHSVKLTVSNATESVTLVRTNEVRVAPAVIYVATNGLHAFPFSTPLTAATNVQSAVDAALATATAASEVRVGEGVYRLPRQVILDKGILLRGESGAALTILTAQAVSGRRVMELFPNAANGAIVEGFTLTGGSLPSLQFGAGLHMLGGTVRSCIISNNIISGRNTQGMGVRMTGGYLLDCIVSDNRGAAGDGSGSNNTGGGILASGGVIERCLIRDNRINSATTAFGGGVFLDGTAVLRNSLVISNYVNSVTVGNIRGAGVYCNAAGSRVENCTIADNYVDVGNSAGLYLNNGGVTNTIIWRNHLSGSDPDNLANHRNYEIIKTNLGYCASYPLPPGLNTIASEPQFVDLASGNYRLMAGSPAIDAGINLAAVTNDYDGAARPVDGNDDAVAVTDMGAFELNPAAIESLTCSFSAEPYQGVNSLEAVFTAVASGPGSESVHYFWDFQNDGVFESDGSDKAVVTNHYGIGIYSVNLVVSNSLGAGTNQLRAGYIQVASSLAYVSTNGGHLAPFETWARAATNIQSAIDTVASGGRVLVSNGVYEVGESLSISRPVTVSGVGDAAATIVRRATNVPAMRLVYVGDPGAVFEGFTIRGGTLASSSGITGPGGAGAYVEKGVVRSCIIVSNSVIGRYACGGGVYLSSGGSVENCLVIGNEVGGGNMGTTYGGGIYMAGGTVMNCTIAGNKAVYDASIGRGGGLYQSGGGVTNTIIVGNTASAGNPDAGSSAASPGFSCSPELAEGVNGNITGDPAFRNPGAGYGLAHVRGDYHLGGGSPCQNAGLVLPGMAVATDLDGEPRIRRNLVDMGCYQALPPRGTILFIR